MKKIYVVFVLLYMCVCLCSCGYSLEEIIQIQQYQEQGEENALNYIKSKYGFDATVLKSSCCKGEFATVLDCVYVTMEYGGRKFTVHVAGDRESVDGYDNYQYQDVLAALQEEIYSVTNVPMEEIFLCYGEYERSMETEKNGLVSVFFDGDNWREVLQTSYASPTVAISYLDRELENIDIKELKSSTGIEYFLLVNYGDEKRYEEIQRPYYNIAGVPLDGMNIIKYLPYIEEYIVTGPEEERFVSCEKQVFDDILVITSQPGEQVILEKESESDTYRLRTESEHIYLYFPIEDMVEGGADAEKLRFRVRHGHGTVCSSTWLTDDEKYIVTGLYMKDYEELKINVITGE